MKHWKKNRIIALVALFALLLAAPVLAFAGDQSDPLLSVSYIGDTFFPKLNAVLDAIAELTDQSVTAALPPWEGDGTVIVTLGPGDSVLLRNGQQLVLISGGVRFEIVSGELVNCTIGRFSTGGDGRIGHRYLVWDGAEIYANCAKEAVVKCSASAEVTRAPKDDPEPEPFDNPFEDVAEGAWYYADVMNAVRRGLVNGMTPTTYAPQGSLTLAQAVKLAACMHQLYTDGAVTLENAAEGAWYDSYAAYALEQGILDALPEAGWNDPVTRETFVRIFFRALPESEYAPINEIPEGAIPDVAGFDPCGKEVYAFYAAGILTGYTAGNGRQAHEFGADTDITRAEVATIMNRMFDPEARVAFSIE